MEKKRLKLALGLGLLTSCTAIFFLTQHSTLTSTQKTSTADDALLALIKNDEAMFLRYLDQGGDLHAALPVLDGRTFTVAEGLSHFERVNFVRLLQQRKLSFIRQQKGAAFDVVSLAVPKNNPIFFELLLKEDPSLNETYGSAGHSLLHIASQHCSAKLLPYIAKGKVSWETKAKDGTTPLTLAARNDCLSALSYWKELGADFNRVDGTGNSAMDIIRAKKDPAMLAFAKSFQVMRTIASVAPANAPVEISFYKKRKIPKEKMVDYSALVEPEDRPLEATETAEYSEFSD